jgi:uncharacterized protein YndB with AHSA1/START domain/DNA-binding transcriptional ArsR family regulator
MEGDRVFEALADPTRRKLLDLLHERDGQTLSELEANFDMTRFGCMKHLKILEAAGLISTQKVGRNKHHYLNPVPIQLVYDRWVSKYAARWTPGLTALKRNLEEPKLASPDHVYYIYINTTAEELWNALTDPALTPQYYYGTKLVSDLAPGSGYTYEYEDGSQLLKGEVLEADKPNKLKMTFQVLWQPGVPGTSTVTYLIEQQEGKCLLTLIHENVTVHGDTAEGIKRGWAEILSGLKTMLETSKTPVR